MRTLAVLPIKSFSGAKQRLAALLGAGSRQALALAMFSDVLTSLGHVEGVDAIAVVTADHGAEAVAAASGALLLRDSEQAGQSQAAAAGIRHAQAAGFERVLLVPGDTPLMDAGELSGLLRRSADAGVGAVIVPDRHGTGTNALLLSPADAIEPSFGPGSRERHVAAADAAGVSWVVEPVPSLVLDVDTPEDLSALTGLLEERRGHAAQTRGALRQLERSQRVSA